MWFATTSHDRCGVSTHRQLGCSFNRLFRIRSQKTSKLRVTGLCVGNSPVTGEYPAQRANNEENASIWWSHHALQEIRLKFIFRSNLAIIFNNIQLFNHFESVSVDIFHNKAYSIVPLLTLLGYTVLTLDTFIFIKVKDVDKGLYLTFVV